MKKFITEGLVVVDTNVILDLYRYTASAREELFGALTKLGDRLWVPHQVAFEFHRNRPAVVASYRDSYSEATKAVADFKRKYESELAESLREFANRVSLPSDVQKVLTAVVAASLAELQSKINELQAQHGISDRFISDDPVLSKVQTLFTDRTGGRLDPEESELVRAEAERRVAGGIAPGFKDSGKEDPTGDYFIWHQMLHEAKRRSASLLFVTRDNKSDWFLKVKGKTIGVLPELAIEAEGVAGVDFIALSTKSFLLHAQTLLNTRVSESTLKQSEAIRTRRETTDRNISAHLMILTRTEFERLRDNVEGGIESMSRAQEEHAEYIDWLSAHPAPDEQEVAAATRRKNSYHEILGEERLLLGFLDAGAVRSDGSVVLPPHAEMQQRITGRFGEMRMREFRDAKQERRSKLRQSTIPGISDETSP